MLHSGVGSDNRRADDGRDARQVGLAHSVPAQNSSLASLTVLRRHVTEASPVERSERSPIVEASGSLAAGRASWRLFFLFLIF